MLVASSFFVLIFNSEFSATSDFMMTHLSAYLRMSRFFPHDYDVMDVPDHITFLNQVT